MKMPERSCTFHVTHFLVLSTQSLLLRRHTTSQRHSVTSHDIILWRQLSHHRSCHLDGTRDISIVLNYHVMKFFYLDLLWPSILAYNPTLSPIKVNSHTKIKVIGQTVWAGECKQTDILFLIQAFNIFWTVICHMPVQHVSKLSSFHALIPFMPCIELF